jgi:glycosyltransferase involved in cell wall biosynthesis
MLKVANIVFNPFKNDSRVLKEAISLNKAGYQVEVIAHGDKGLPAEENLNGVKVKRFGYLNRKDRPSTVEKLKIYLAWIREVSNYVKDFDILHCNDLNTLPIAFIVKRFYNSRVKVIYDAHEYERETIALRGFKKTAVKFLEKFLIRYTDRVITVSNSIANEYKRLYPDIERPALVLNTPNYQDIEKKDIFREIFNIDRDKKIFLYQGGLSKGRGIEILLETFKRLSKENSSAVAVFMGYGELEEMVKDASKRYKNIFFHPAVSPDILLEYTSSADFGISTIEDSCLSYRYCLPNKLFEYLIAEIPVVVSNLYEMREFVKKYNVGVVAKENTPDGLKEAIKEALELDINKVKESIKEVKKLYNWENQERVLIDVYRGV